MNPLDREEYLKRLWEQLRNSTRFQIVKGGELFSKAPKKPGVYCIWEDDRLCYVGETRELYARTRDLLQTRNSTFRRKLGKGKFSSCKGFIQATTRNNFPPEIEKELDDYIRLHMRLVFLDVNIGRKELEEYILSKSDKSKMYNSPQKRGITISSS